MSLTVTYRAADPATLQSALVILPVAKGPLPPALASSTWHAGTP